MTTLFIGNLNYQTTEQDLREQFSNYGVVQRINIIADRDTGQPKGYAFIDMEGGADEAARAMNGAEFDGRPLTVSVAKSKEGGPQNGRQRRSRSS